MAATYVNDAFCTSFFFRCQSVIYTQNYSILSGFDRLLDRPYWIIDRDDLKLAPPSPLSFPHINQIKSIQFQTIADQKSIQADPQWRKGTA